MRPARVLLFVPRDIWRADAFPVRQQRSQLIMWSENLGTPCWGNFGCQWQYPRNKALPRASMRIRRISVHGHGLIKSRWNQVAGTFKRAARCLMQKSEDRPTRSCGKACSKHPIHKNLIRNNNENSTFELVESHRDNQLTTLPMETFLSEWLSPSDQPVSRQRVRGLVLRSDRGRQSSCCENSEASHLIRKNLSKSRCLCKRGHGPHLPPCSTFIRLAGIKPSCISAIRRIRNPKGRHQIMSCFP